MKKLLFLFGLIIFPAFCGQLVHAGSEEFLSSYTSLSDAITSIGTTEASLVIDQNATLTADLTVPANINLRFVKGNTIGGAYTLTINGNMTAGQWQIFGSDITPAGTPLVKSILPEWFPGTDTQAIQAAIDFAVTAGSGVTGAPGKTYSVSSVRIKNGVKSFIFKGSIAGDGTSPYGIITLDGPAIFYGTAVDRCYISVNLDMSNGDLFGINADACTNCIFDNCRITGFSDSPASRFGIRLWKNSNYNKIINNEIIGAEFHSSTYAAVLIAVFGESETFGGFFNNGQITDPTAPCVGNIISGNTLISGEVAIDLLACEDTIITDNYCYKNSTRAIYTSNSTNNCIIANNLITGFGSSAILIGYGTHNNIINNNICRQIYDYNSICGEAAINVICGTSENLITGNTIESFTHYGIYLATNVIGNVVEGNNISAYYLSAIALENDFQDTPPSGALYSRPNYAAPSIGSIWASLDSEKNVILNNVIEAEYSGRQVGAIYVSQLGSTQTINNVIQSNAIIRPQLAVNWPLWFFEENSGKLTENILKNNTVRDVTLTRLYFSRGRQHFSACQGNNGLDDGTGAFTPGDSTPSVGIGGNFRTCNSSSVTITNFDDGFDGQVFNLQLDQYTTVQHSASAIFTKNASDITGTSNTQFVTFKKIGTVWYEINRSF